MILLDTNFVIYASHPESPFHQWALALIASSSEGEGIAINAISIAEFCTGDLNPQSVMDRLLDWEIRILDIPASAAVVCAAAYRNYRKRRADDFGNPGPATPLPDFFIGAHAHIMGWEIATADKGRFATYFPSVKLLLPN